MKVNIKLVLPNLLMPHWPLATKGRQGGVGRRRCFLWQVITDGRLRLCFQSITPSFHPVDLCVGTGLLCCSEWWSTSRGEAKKFRKNMSTELPLGNAGRHQAYIDPLSSTTSSDTDRTPHDEQPSERPENGRNKKVLIVAVPAPARPIWLKRTLCNATVPPLSQTEGSIVVECGKLLQGSNTV